MKAVVTSIGKQSSTEDALYFTSQECIAELIEPLTPNSENWFVRFPGDRDEQGQPRKRIRRLVRMLK